MVSRRTGLRGHLWIDQGCAWSIPNTDDCIKVENELRFSASTKFRIWQGNGRVAHYHKTGHRGHLLDRNQGRAWSIHNTDDCSFRWEANGTPWTYQINKSRLRVAF
jgi:hypothetical protein